MAYAALISLAGVLEQFLHSAHDREQMESLHSNVVFLQKLLEDFPGDRSLMMKQLESRITDAAYQTEDIIACEISDSTTRTAILSESDPGQFPVGGICVRLGCCLVGFRILEYARRLSLRGMFSTLESCIEEVNSIVEDATEIKKILQMKKGIVGRESLTAMSSPTGPPSGKDAKVGHDTDLIQIKERLVGHNSDLHIIPITGMGGIGKTTLAKIVFEDPVTVARFDFRIWVTISQEYHTQRILREILSVSETNPKNNWAEENNVGSLIVGVHKSLIGRRFLIIIDDIWHVEAWDSVRNAFPDNKNGSRIILTSRLVEVAAKVDSSSPLHQMQLLNEYQSWALFKKEVFGQRSCPLQLENIGKIISKRCKGLPLAIVVIGGLLKLNFTKYYWENFAKSINGAEGPTRDDQLFGILSLSYDNLPPHLKACFLYMTVFPEDDEIPVKKLVRLWVAEGFLKPKRNKKMEEVAEEYLVDLVDRNLFTVRKKRSNGKIRTCSIHDVLRELSLRKAKEEKFSQHFICEKTYGDSNPTENLSQHFIRRYHPHKTNSATVYLRRLGVYTSTAATLPLLLNPDSKTVRSLIFSQYYPVPFTYLPTFRLLRVLDALQIHFKFCDDEVFSLVCLRYLALTYICETSGVHLSLLHYLRNLETLIIKHEGHYSVDDGSSFSFPILELPKLRHFVLIRNSSLMSVYYRIYEPGQRIRISNTLQTLSGVSNLNFTKSLLQILENLVRLKINYVNVESDQWNRYCLNSLVHLYQLEELSLMFHNRNTIPLPPNILFPDKLKKLTLTRFRIYWEKMSVIGSLPNLEVLKLVGSLFESGEWEPVEGEFQLLKYLKLKVGNLKEWKVESSHFPCLEQLVISECDRLEEVPTEIGEIATLKKLVIHSYYSRIQKSATNIQEEQRSYGNELQVQIVEPKTWWHN